MKLLPGPIGLNIFGGAGGASVVLLLFESSEAISKARLKESYLYNTT